MDGIDAEILCPEEFHLLAQLLVHGPDNETGRQAQDVRGAIDYGGTEDDETVL